MNGTHLAVDLGSSGGKVILTGITGERKVSSREIHRFQTPRAFLNGHLSTDVYRIFGEIMAALGMLSKEGVRISSLGIDSWSSDFGLVDPAGSLIGLPVFYRDSRTLGMPEEVEKVISYEELYPLSTQRRMRDSTLCQLLALRRESPSQLLGGNRILFLADALAMLLSGRVASEMTLASYSQMFSMEKMIWEDRVFDLFGLPRSLQAEVVHPGDWLGTLDGRAAEWYGVDRFEVLATAGHDTSSAVAAVPAEPDSSWAFISTGSWFLVGMELDGPTNLSLCYRYNCSNTGLAFRKTMLKRNVTAMWLFQECKRKWAQLGIPSDDARIDQLAAGAKPFLAALDVDSPELYNPGDMPSAISRLIKSTAGIAVDSGDVGQIARLLHEGIAFKCAYAIRCLERITGRRIDRIHVVGGVSGAGFLNQMIASASGREVVAGPREATGIGNGLLQAYGCGEIASADELREVVRRTFPLTRYAPLDEAAWSERYGEYHQACGLPE